MAKDDKKKPAKKARKAKTATSKAAPAAAAPAEALARLDALKAELAALEAALRGAPEPEQDGPQVSPLAPAGFPDLPEVAGVRFATVEAGVRYKGRPDVMLAMLAPGTSVAGVFTTSATRAAPVLWCEARRAGAAPKGAQAILANAGNANAFTGDNGRKSVEAVAAALTKAAGVPKSGIWLASTGVIGEPLPHERIEARLDDLVAALDPGAVEPAARAIMTTDTFPKGAGETLALGGVETRVAGFCKGSGMIAPDMATMLGFLFTDAPVERPLLQKMLSEIAERTFNCVTVDGDTSTSDTLLLAATGRAGGPPIKSMRDPRAPLLRDALERAASDLAQQLARDGEGASKFVTLRVTGAKSDRSAKRIALAVANSPLVKTALAGEDPNWGRIVMAIGKAGEPADRDRISIRFGDVAVAENGWVAASYREAQGAAVMKQAEIEIGVDLGLGDGEATVWTCDLTHGYVSINADYRS
ncbi:MAG: bifunctional glutamate N-acetyltransferase/amino-acid acetyltransferase ArgJ [Pseudomonadota bacterium]